MTLIYVPAGELEEQIWAQTETGGILPTVRRRVRRGQSMTAHASAHPLIHRLVNRGRAEAMSIHVYAPAVSREQMRDWEVEARPTNGPASTRAFTNIPPNRRRLA